jgi:hypothetical protein
MNEHCSGITRRRKIEIGFLAIVSLALLPTIATAHGG